MFKTCVDVVSFSGHKGSKVCFFGFFKQTQSFITFIVVVLYSADTSVQNVCRCCSLLSRGKGLKCVHVVVDFY